ncbi:MAG TPA: ATP-binding protein [Candidatus Dormibacteraeota bacterium]|nr:ATP-binding protein [Candidatus Dormibacteraeota bacterium]
MTRIRSSFALRLLAAGVALSLVLIVGISTFLLISRQQQTRTAAVTNAGNRAAVIGQLFDNVTRPELNLDAKAVAQELTDVVAGRTSKDSSPQDILRVIDGTGVLIQRSGSGAFGEYPVLVTADQVFSPPGVLRPSPASLTLRDALQGKADYGIELLPDTNGPRAVSDAGNTVFDLLKRPIAAVVYVVPIVDELQHFKGVIGYSTAFIPVASPSVIARLSKDGKHASGGTTPSVIEAGVRAGDPQHPPQGTYDLSGLGTVAGSFVPLLGPDGKTAAYVGVEAPLSEFVGDVRSDEFTLGLIGIFAILGTALLVFFFVERFVRRPVNRLERGVARIAGGDYSTDIPVTSSDELGRLAVGVNRMRAEIADYITLIEQARARLDGAVDELGGVSRALTTTTRGVAGLQEAVVGAAAAIAGHGSAALLLIRDGDNLSLRAAHGIEGRPPDISGWKVGPALLEGRSVRVDQPPPGWKAGGMLAVPMFYQDAVVGALAVVTRAGEPPAEGQEQSLAVLANNAAIALENTRLFEQERETVRRLRELDALKSDFLGTVQHELRTPLTAIMGMGDLLEMCWETWDDAHKTEALHDIQVAAKKLYDIVETILDFSLLESDTLSLKQVPTQVRGAVEEAVTAVQARLKEGLQVSLSVDVPTDVEVYADPARFNQALRALLDNAVKFTPEGGSIWVRTHRNGGNMVRIEVADNGIGIPEDALPRVFERFYQVDNTATRTYGGTGMGLALVRRLVEAHGGSVEVESRVGVGTCFALLWPVAPIVM